MIDSGWRSITAFAPPTITLAAVDTSIPIVLASLSPHSGTSASVAIASLTWPTSNETGVIAVAHVVLNNCFALHDLMLVKELAEDGKFKVKLFMPTKDDGEGNRRNVYYPTKREFFEKLLLAILEEYKKGLNG